MANTKIPSELSSTPSISDSGNATAITITSAEKVGIGSATPGQLLTVNAADGVLANEYVASFVNAEATDGQSFGVVINAGSNSSDIALNIATHDGGTVLGRLRGDGTLLIPSGNVGIGTQSPNQDGFDANATVLSVKSANNGEGVLELIGGGNSSGDQVAVINMMSQSATAPAAQIKALRYTADDAASMTLNTSGTERLRIDSQGHIGINDSSPAANSSSYKTLNIGGGIVMKNSSTNSLNYVFESRFNGSNNITLAYASNGSSHTAAVVGAQNNLPLQFYTNGAVRVRLSSDRMISGDVGVAGAPIAVGCTIGSSNWLGLTADLPGYSNGIYPTLKSTYGNLYISTGGGYVAYINNSGGYNVASDQRLKENVVTLEDPLDKVNQLRGVTFNWIDDSRGTDTQVGFIAQEVEAVIPELVTTGDLEDDDSGEAPLKTVNYANMTALLVEAVKELKAENDALKTRIEALEG